MGRKLASKIECILVGLAEKLGGGVLMRVKVEYSDQNEPFAAYLPRVGQAVRSLVCDDGTLGWFLFELDEPFEYELRMAEALLFPKGLVTHFLLRSRWKGYELGAAEPTSVFILLVEKGALPLKESVHIKDYVHIAWGMCSREPSGA